MCRPIVWTKTITNRQAFWMTYYKVSHIYWNANPQLWWQIKQKMLSDKWLVINKQCVLNLGLNTTNYTWWWRSGTCDGVLDDSRWHPNKRPSVIIQRMGIKWHFPGSREISNYFWFYANSKVDSLHMLPFQGILQDLKSIIIRFYENYLHFIFSILNL